MIYQAVLAVYQANAVSTDRDLEPSPGPEPNPIPGSEPSQPYHSLVARVCDHGVSSTGGCPHGCALRPGRFNEFVSFHDCRAYPEYLVAYRRE